MFIALMHGKDLLLNHLLPNYNWPHLFYQATWLTSQYMNRTKDSYSHPCEFNCLIKPHDHRLCSYVSQSYIIVRIWMHKIIYNAASYRAETLLHLECSSVACTYIHTIHILMYYRLIYFAAKHLKFVWLYKI